MYCSLKKRYAACLKELYNSETGKWLHEVMRNNACLNCVLKQKNIKTPFKVII